MKDPDLKRMSVSDIEDEVMLLRAKVKVLQNAAAESDRTIVTLAEQLRMLALPLPLKN